MIVERKVQNIKRDKDEDYIECINFFHEEYTKMLKNFLERHDIEVKETDCLINYIYKTRIFMPRFTSYTIPITTAMYNESMSDETKFMILMNSYQNIKMAFSK